jgi:hypothetical protein
MQKRDNKQPPPAFHHTILVTDIENFTDPTRTNLDQLAVRRGLYKVIKHAFAKIDVNWASCRAEDRGDGVFVLIPPDVPKVKLATTMLSRLGAALRSHNASRSARTRFRLRAALHAGEVHYDSHGVAGNAINHAFRLVQAPVLKAALETSAANLAVIVSEWFFDEVIRHYPAARPGRYERVGVPRADPNAGWVRLVVPPAGRAAPAGAARSVS